MIIKKIKNKFPSLIVTTEVNASPFDENFANIANKSYFENLEEKSLKYAHANFFVSGFLRDRIIQTPVNSRDYVVHNGVEEIFFKLNTIKKASNGKIVFGYIGTIDYHKNLDKLIDAFEEVLQISDKKIELVIVGDGPLYKELKDYVLNKNLNNEVSFTGWVKHTEIPSYLQSIDIAIHHSAKPYMSPLKLFEYMAAGKAVIGPDIPAVREIFTSDELCLVKADLSNLSSVMQMVLNDDSYRMKLSVNSRKIVKEKFKWSDNAEKIIAVMQTKLNENN
jgi:glycosyltransferase involved in cell wall biosynthesis